MPSFDVDFEVYCSCEAGLCNQSSTKGMGVIVEPCEKCLEKRYDDGYDKGYSTGYDEARSEFEV